MFLTNANMHAEKTNSNSVDSLDRFDSFDATITRTMARYGIPLLRIGLGIVFIWFGALKMVPGLSPAEDLVRKTVYFVNPDYFIPVLAIWEVVIGAALLLHWRPRVTLLLMFPQLIGTTLPLFLLPTVVWSDFPLVLTLEGQYILKNLVLLPAAVVLGGTVRGARLDYEPASSRITCV